VTVRLAVEATSRWTRSNTNLGIILLLAPIARAALLESTVESGLRPALRRVLQTTTVDDARHVYSAIRTAAPGGLGRVAEQDVAGEPTMTLLDVMRLARDRDGIAREYSTGFQVTFETAAPALDRARRDGCPWEDSVVEAFLTVLAEHPDTHVTRRGGATLAAEVSQRARAALAAGGVRSTAGRHAIGDLDRALREGVPAANPGTTADIIAAAIFVALLGGGWQAGGDEDAGAR
jgi:triphosphoribosyl-dephospho-CoA synthase